ncbi:hypothetical protein JCM16303_005647 [Sporobolomyces ruberrimus]
MRIVVTGASGFLGREVYSALSARQYDVTGLAFSRSSRELVRVDLNDSRGIEALLEGLKPDVVVHCAAERRPDVCEASPDAARSLNVRATSNLARLSSALKFALIYISTDYVFDGTAPPGGYEVTDEPAPTNLYGETKREGEKAVLEARVETGAKATVLRVPVLYGSTMTNSESAINCLFDVVLACAGKERRAKMDDWAARYPTNTLDVARVVADLADLSLSRPLPSTLHFSAQERLTKYEILKIFASAHAPPLELDEAGWLIRDDAGPQPGDTIRPKDCHLSNRALEALGIDCSTAVTFGQWAQGFVSQQQKRA